MSFGEGSKASVPGFKSFVSEAEVEEKKRIRQEEWEKVRKPDDPEEAPEEEVDPRSLYEQLQAQKDAKDAEYQEKHRLSNQVKGLEDDEAEFLDFVSNRQMEIDKAREDQAKAAMSEIRDVMASRIISVPDEKTVNRKSAKPIVKGQKSSQLSLLAGAIKRKSVELWNCIFDGVSSSKKMKLDSTSASSVDQESTSSSTTTTKSTSPDTQSNGQIAHPDQMPSSSGDIGDKHNSADLPYVAAILPGIGSYGGDSDNSDSDESSSDEDDINTDILPKRIQLQMGHT